MTRLPDPPPVHIAYLNRLDIEALALSDAEILAAIEDSPAMQGRGETVVEPRTHIEPRAGLAVQGEGVGLRDLGRRRRRR